MVYNTLPSVKRELSNYSMIVLYYPSFHLIFPSI